jgi:AcrR family transcriptional regulator
VIVRLAREDRRAVIERAATEVFAERGYQAAAIDEIARRSGVSAPVVYDHFDSKRDLHARLLERHLAEMRSVWAEHLVGEGDAEERIAGALDAWFAYVESHPYAWRMIFRDTTGDPEVQADHKRIQAESSRGLLPLLATLPGGEDIGGEDEASRAMVIELLRSAIAGLALWWYEHRQVPREQVVAAAMNALWIGFGRLAQGERWAQPRRRPEA